MANPIRIKRRAAGGAAGAPASLENAELAYNEQDNILYYGTGTGGAGGSATQIIPIAGPGAFAPLTGTGVSGTWGINITGNAATATTAASATDADSLGGVAAANYAPKASPTFTGTPAAPTATVGNISTQIATTAFVNAEIANDAPSKTGTGASGTWPIAITGNAASATSATTATNATQLGGVVAADYAQKASPALTGVPTAPTAAAGTNTTQIATTAFVVQNFEPLGGGADIFTVKVASTVSRTLSGLATWVDGSSLAEGDIILLKNQGSSTENGVYIASAGSWTRHSAFADTSASGKLIRVKSGTVNQSRVYYLDVGSNPYTAGTSNTYFSKVISSGDFGTTLPVVNGTAGAGSADTVSRGDHVHPIDTSRAALASPTFTGTPAAPTAAVGVNTTQLATTAYVLANASSSTPAALGTAAIGTSTRHARADHVHVMPTLSQVGAPTAAVSLNSQKITNLATPTADSDAATKLYVDGAIQGIDAKASVRAVTLGDTVMAGLITIDGVTLAEGDRVLVRVQDTGASNGIYIASAGGWTRAPDMNTSAEIPSAYVWVEEGINYGDTGWLCTADSTAVLGTTALNWVQFSGAGQITAGDGLTKSGNTIDVVGTSNRIAVTSNAVDIASTYVGQTSITTLGTITTGTWSGTTVAVNKGGTGATTLTGLLKGNGTSAFTAAVAGTDYLSPSSTIDGGTF